MKYRSTRDTSLSPVMTESSAAIKKGLAPDSGLYVPEEIPQLSEKDLEALTGMDYPERAAYILSLFLTDYDGDFLRKACREAYSVESFGKYAAPVKKVKDGLYSLELWHGPTCAFKDMALQIMPRLLSEALRMTGEKNLTRILVATSGDTGKAALEGYRDIEGTDIMVFYPKDGVSKMQERQMATQEGNNVAVYSVYGNFDDVQTKLKEIFSDKGLADRAKENGILFSSANSINWGRLVPQVVYYISAYCDLVASGDIVMGDKINVCVPTGNFGNIFAGYIARRMGLPVKRFICASNSNNVLTDFINNGVYDKRREFYKTMSPSMDILVSSNLERLLFMIGGSDMTADLMKQLSENGIYKIDGETHAKIKEMFSGYCLAEDETAATIKKIFGECGYLTDTHTAVGVGCALKYISDTDDRTAMVVASTASPYKFPMDVGNSIGMNMEKDDPEYLLRSLSEYTGTPIPRPLERTLELPVRFTASVRKEELDGIVTKR